MHSLDRHLPRRIALVLAILLALGSSCARLRDPDLTVLVVPAVEGIPITAPVPVFVDPAELMEQAQPGQPLHFPQVQRGQNYKVRAGSGFVGRDVTVAIKSDGRATVKLAVIQIDPAPEPTGVDGGTDNTKSLEVDITSGAPKLAWKQGRVTASTREVRSGDDLPSVFDDEWKSNGMHRAETDPKMDPAHIVVKPDTTQARIEEVAKAILSVKRKSLGTGAVIEVSAFAVRVMTQPAVDPEESAEREADAAEPPAVLTPEEIELARKRAGAIRAIGVELYGKLAVGNGNLAFSPLSVMGCLAMANDGAAGKTGTQLSRILRAPAQADAMHSQIKALLKASRSRNKARGGAGDKVKSVRLRVAHGIWVQQDNPLLPEYTFVLQRDFDARAANLDFQRDASGAAKVINGWIDTQTHGKIKEPVSASVLGPQLRAVLVDAVYFRGRFANPFERKRTESSDFRLADGTKVRVPTMRDTRDFDYVKGQGFQALRIPYTVQDFSLVLILPDEGQVGAVEQRLGTVLDQAVGRTKAERIFITLPHVQFAWKQSLVAPLKALGVTDAWDGKVADFSRLTETGGFFLSELIHSTMLSINEDGTEAAAATAGFGSGTGRATVIEMRFDRPFLFAIHDAWMGTFLFMGRVSDPR